MKYRLLFFINIAAAQLIYWLRIFLNLTYDSAFTDPVCLSLFSIFMGIAFISFFIAAYMAIREIRSVSELDALEKEKQLREQQNKNLQQIHMENMTYKSEILQLFSKLRDSLKTENQEIICKNYKLLNRQLDSFSSYNYCNHSLINAILYEKRQTAEKHQIQADYSIRMPEEMAVPLPSLANIFFNLLDNAIESCTVSSAESPFIQLKVNYRGNMLSIHMLNSKTLKQLLHARQRKKTLCPTVSACPSLKILFIHIMEPVNGLTKTPSLNLF